MLKTFKDIFKIIIKKVKYCRYISVYMQFKSKRILLTIKGTTILQPREIVILIISFTKNNRIKKHTLGFSYQN